MKRKENKNSSGLKVIPLGGLEQIGLNMTAFEYEDSIIVVDCGLSFPADDMLGIDLVIPDVTYLKDNIDRVKGFVITHGHEDHIGALPYVLKDINVPVYATRLTMGIIENKLKEHNLVKTTKRKVVKFGQSINMGQFRVEFIKTNHSIVDAAALAIYSPAGVVVHTGDFKVDYTPVFGDAIDLQRLAELGKKGVLALMCDSTNAERPGFTPSERTVGHTFDTLFEEHKNTRIFVATFASNVDRVQQIINTAYKFGRKVCVEGRSMVSIIETARNLECISIPENTLIEIDQLKDYPDEKQVIITTGSQGESMAALSRMAGGMHRKITVGAGDTVIFSSNPIPGNEKSVTKVINELLRKGADVIFQDAHVSGHARTRGVQASEGSGKDRPESGHGEGEYFHAFLRRRAGTWGGQREGGGEGSRGSHSGGWSGRGRRGQRCAAGPSASCRRRYHDCGYESGQGLWGAGGRTGYRVQRLRVCERIGRADGGGPPDRGGGAAEMP